MSEFSYRGLFDLTGKIAVVTGGAGILGEHFCAGLVESGAKVAVVDLDEDKAVALAKELSFRYKSQVVGIGCDVSDPASVKAMVAHVVAAFGEINILHNNAASKSDNLDNFFAPFEEYGLEQWRKIMSVNLDGMFLVAQAVGRQMVAQAKGGSIIQTASIYGVMSPDHRIYEGSFYLGRKINTPAVYTASKAGIIGLTKYLATYWADKGIRVNTLTPGGTESGQNDEFKRRYSNRIPMNRMAEAHEMVGALLYLTSDASSYVTGQNIIVDGGFTSWQNHDGKKEEYMSKAVRVIPRFDMKGPNLVKGIHLEGLRVLGKPGQFAPGITMRAVLMSLCIWIWWRVFTSGTACIMLLTELP